MLFGHMSCFLTQIGIGFFIMLEYKVCLFIMANIYCFGFSISNQAVVYLYCNEISTDIALAVVFTVYCGLMFVQSTFFFSTMDLLTREGYFFYYSIWSLLGFFFTHFFCGETKGLNDKEKKEMFCPGAKYGRRLKPEETC